MEEVAVLNEKNDGEAGKGTAGVAPRSRALAIALAVGVIAVCWFMLLSNWLGVRSGTVLMSHQNVLFDSDTSMWVDQMIHNAVSTQPAVHPLETVFWRYPSRALQHLAMRFTSREYATVFGPRLLVNLIAGAGVGFLAYLALYLGIPTLQGVLLFCCYMLFSVNTLIVLPEHFGISNGLLTMAFVVLVVVANERLRNGALAVLAVLCGGTTILNVLLPVYCLFESLIKSARLKTRLLIAAIPVGLGSALLVFKLSKTVSFYFHYWAYVRLLSKPAQAFIYSVYLVAAPAVGARPWIKAPDWLMVTYDTLEHDPALAPPLDFSHYFNIQGIGAVLWLVLLARCIQVGFRDTQTRPYVQMAVVWVVFSLIFFNVWGREPFLYSSGWSWALMALVLLGARHVSRTFIVAMVVPIMLCQLVALHDIGSLLGTITH